MKVVDSSLAARVEETILRYNMFPRGCRVGAAVSGGADSVALLLLLCELAPRWNWTVTVLHCNHGLRGEESDADEQFVRRLADTLGLPVFAAPAGAREGRGNLEQRARRLRYDFFRQARRDIPLDRVATGHTRSDQAETVLFRLLRGSGTAGLSGIRPLSEGEVARPLLEVSRQELRRWLLDGGHGWREDSSNLDARFARNRIRMRLMPELERDWNPGIEGVLAHTATLALEEEQYWEAELERYLAGAVSRHRLGMLVNLDGIAGRPVILQRRLMRSALAKVRGDLRRIDFVHVDELLRLATRERGSGRLRLPGVTAIRSFRQILLMPVGQALRPYRMVITPGVAARVGEAGVALRVEPGPASGETRYNTSGETGQCWLLDGSKIGGCMELRSWRPGDSYQPAGHGAPRKLKELFHHARIPLWERTGWPMVEVNSQIVWSRGFGPAAGLECGPQSELILRIWEEESGVP